MKQEQVNIEVVSIDDLIQDDHNFNKGNEQGAQLLERSFRECGAGRSVLIDKDNRLVGGNKAQKGFKAAGKKKVIIVDSDADTLVAVRRKDVSLDSAEGRKMAYLDNLTTQVNLTWDETELQAVQADVEGFDIADFGVDIEDLPQVTFPGDKNAGEDVNPDDYGEEFTLPEGDKSPFQQMTFTLADAEAELIKGAIETIKQTEAYKSMETYGNNNSNGNAIYLIVKQWAEQRK